MQELSLESILSLFRNEFDKSDNSGARILDSIYHMTLQLIKKSHLGEFKATGYV